jgi:hypothetical protein
MTTEDDEHRDNRIGQTDRQGQVGIKVEYRLEICGNSNNGKKQNTSENNPTLSNFVSHGSISLLNSINDSLLIQYPYTHQYTSFHDQFTMETLLERRFTATRIVIAHLFAPYKKQKDRRGSSIRITNASHLTEL